ncbi:MAG TPA: phosphatidylglycerophosphatase A [Desulfatiglandales bacterium]|nr:phosphatidylglycerophosphatase A [Desulfatiglandales bacterium]
MDYVKEKGLALKEAFILLLSSWFGVGRLPLAPGTLGTLGAVPLVLIISYFGPVPSVISLAVIIPLAVWTSGISQKLLGKDDPPEVVIDEVAGYFVAVFLLPFSWWSFIPGFLLFRIFDILKPFPIRMIHKKVSGGIGICLDDIAAGVYANVCIRLLLFLWFL